MAGPNALSFLEAMKDTGPKFKPELPSIPRDQSGGSYVSDGEWLASVINRPNSITVSASAIESFMDCPRKWWLSKIRKLRVAQTHAQTVGDALHNVAERFLLADDLGRDRETGLPVELFPDGWDIPVSRFGGASSNRLSTDEKQLVQELIQKAIDLGYLRREAYREVEAKIDRVVAYFPVTCSKCQGTQVVKGQPCDRCEKGTIWVRVKIFGFIDWCSPTAIRDHKTAKNTRYLKTPKTLPQNVQLLIYAFVKLFQTNYTDQYGKQVEVKPEREVPPECELTHIQYMKTRKAGGEADVRDVTVNVSRQHVESFWETSILPVLEKMAYHRENARSVCSFPDPKNPSVCQKYGGCEYRHICAGKISEAEFEHRFALKSPKKKDKENPDMTTPASNSIFNAALGNVNPAAVPPAPVPPVPAAVPVPPPPAAPVAPAVPTPPAAPVPAPPTPEVAAPAVTEAPAPPVQTASAPWYQEGCVCCSKNALRGFNSAGSAPCPICDKTSREAKGPYSSQYTISNDEQGHISWTEKPAETAPAVPAPVAAPVPEAPAAQVPAPAEVPAPVVPETLAAPEEPPAPAPEKPKTKRDKKPAKFVLYVNCRPIKGVTGVKDGFETFQEVGASLAKESQVDSYWQLDPFKRKDAISQFMPSIHEQLLAGKKVACTFSNTGDDYDRFVKEMMAVADEVYRAL